MKATIDSLRTAIALSVLLVLPCRAHAQVAVKGKVILTMAGDPILDGVVVIEKGKIAAIGKAADVKIPDGIKVVEAGFVTPGLIDARSTVGLSGILNVPADQDQVDKSEAMQPELRAIDAYNAREELIGWIRGFGVTTIHTGHGPGPLISGQTLIAKLHGSTVDEAVIVPCAMIAATLGSQDGDAKAKGPGTRARAAAVLRQALLDAKAWSEKRAKDDKVEMKLKNEALARLLNRELPLLVTADRPQDITTAIRIAQEFNLRLVLDSAASCASLVPEIKKAGCPVFLHPTMARPSGDRRDLRVDDAATLRAAGIPFALEAGFEGYVPKTRVVLFEAGMACANGLDHRDAMAAITIDAATLLGIEKRVGSLELGKDGDLALYDGDPFEWTSHCTGTIIEGESFAGEKR